MGVREGLLALLTAGPKHGYQLRQEFESATAGVWPLNIGQVYTTLDRLQRDGLIEAVDDATPAAEPGTGGKAAERRRYRLTRAGRDELGDWFSAGPDPAPHREPTVIKVLVALHTEGVDVRQVIDVQRQALLAHLAEQQRARRKAIADAEQTADDADDRASATDAISTLMVFDALVTRTEADLRWLDLCDELLATRRRPAPPSAAAPSPTDRPSRKDRS
jgi:DNA-binding PadR family transcriptional regulator